MFDILRRLWMNTNHRKLAATAPRSRRGWGNIERLESRSMLSAAPTTVDYVENLIVDSGRLDTIFGPEQPSGSEQRPIMHGNGSIFRPIPNQWSSLVPPTTVELPTLPATDLPDSSDSGGFVSTNSNHGELFTSPRVEQPNQRESHAVRQVIAGLSFTIKESTVHTTKESKFDTQSSPALRAKPLDKPDTTLKRATVVSPQLMPQPADDSDGGMVTLLYHKVADKSAMMTKTSAADIQSILDQSVQIDRAYGTFQAFEVSSGETPVRSTSPAKTIIPPTPKPIDAPSVEGKRVENREVEPAIDAISFAPELEVLATSGSLDIKLDEVCVDSVFAAAEEEEQLEQAMTNPSLYQVITAIAIATAAYRAHSHGTREPDKSTNSLSAAGTKVRS
jgi:hypothetical protein